MDTFLQGSLTRLIHFCFLAVRSFFSSWTKRSQIPAAYVAQTQICVGDELDLHHDLVFCRKNQGHKSFTPVSEFDINCLPAGFREQGVLDTIRLLEKLTVLVKTKVVSKHRPSRDRHECYRNVEGFPESGSGWLWSPQKCKFYTDVPCVCMSCIDRGNPTLEWGELRVYTAKHVVFDDAEAYGAELRLFYNNDDTLETVRTLSGVSVDSSDSGGDMCELVVVTHDKNLWAYVTEIISYAYNTKSKFTERSEAANDECERTELNNNLAVIISHPHGCNKQISVGRWLDRKVVRTDGGCLEWVQYVYNTPTCPGCSGAPVYVVGREGWRVTQAPHKGALDLEKRTNISGVGLEWKQLKENDTASAGDVGAGDGASRNSSRGNVISVDDGADDNLSDWDFIDSVFGLHRKTTELDLYCASSAMALSPSSSQTDTGCGYETNSCSMNFVATAEMTDLHRDFRYCASNPSHSTFIPFPNFSPEHLPQTYKELFSTIQHLGNITGRVRASLVSPQRPIHFPHACLSQQPSVVLRFATGWLQLLDGYSGVGIKPCPCVSCHYGPEPFMSWRGFVLRTACHVVFNDEEALRCAVDFCYDSSDLSKVKTLRGVKVIRRDEEADLVDLYVVTHDVQFAEKLRHDIQMFSLRIHEMNRTLAVVAPFLVVIVSHPHGRSKHVSIGLTVMDEAIETDKMQQAAVEGGTSAIEAPSHGQFDSSPASQIAACPLTELPSALQQTPICSLSHLTNDAFDTPTAMNCIRNLTDKDSEQLKLMPQPRLNPSSSICVEIPFKKITSRAILPSSRQTSPGNSSQAQNNCTASCHGYVPSTEPPLFSKPVKYYVVDSCRGSSGAPVMVVKGNGLICWPMTHGRDQRQHCLTE
ncbi:uncharacterized protein LOC101857815 [Aplysia californica]|uniref:Uncharacterized protein LOC101857815 n=1 Tax=Aplysia californica TaxID=6500 RepID=A0ABM0JZQ1_APLCA|nr:uncharacterized protein LOC101857815 [Aplysia californica]